jgi:hypothetical protein
VCALVAASLLASHEIALAASPSPRIIIPTASPSPPHRHPHRITITTAIIIPTASPSSPHHRPHRITIPIDPHRITIPIAASTPPGILLAFRICLLGVPWLGPSRPVVVARTTIILSSFRKSLARRGFILSRAGWLLLTMRSRLQSTIFLRNRGLIVR